MIENNPGISIINIPSELVLTGALTAGDFLNIKNRFSGINHIEVTGCG